MLVITGTGEGAGDNPVNRLAQALAVNGHNAATELAHRDAGNSSMV